MDPGPSDTIVTGLNSVERDGFAIRDDADELTPCRMVTNVKRAICFHFKDNSHGRTRVKCLSPKSIWLGVIILVGLPSVAECVTLNQVDTFQGSKNSWTDGHGGDNGTVVTTGGPNGIGDPYLQVSSGTFGTEPRLITFNQAQWTGNYIAAGVGSISMELKNFGTSTLPIRITLRDATGGSNIPGYSSTNAFLLPADGNWHLAQFQLDNAHMTPVGAGLPPLSTELTAVKDFRLLSAAQPSINGNAISARIGVDDISAGPVPEPSAFTLLAVGGAALIAGRAYKCRLAPFASLWPAS